MGEPLTGEGAFALRSELRKLMRIARIARPVALYDASFSAQTFENIDESIIYPIDFAEVVEVNLIESIGGISHSHIPGYDEFSRKFPKSANMADLIMG